MTHARFTSFIPVVALPLTIVACSAPEHVAGARQAAAPNLAIAASAAGIPDISFYNSRAGITVVDQNGAGNSLGSSWSNIGWGRGGAGTLTSPFRLIYNSASKSSTGQVIMMADVYLDAGTDKLVNARAVPTANGNNSPALSPDNSLIAYTKSTGGTTQALLSTINSDGTNELVRFTTLGGYALARPVFSPDGKKIAVIMNQIGVPATYSIQVIDLVLGGNTVPLAAGVFSVNDLDWTNNNELVLTAADGSGISKVYGLDMNTAGSVPVFITNGIRAAASGDGSKIVYTAAAGNTDLVIYDRIAGTRKTIVSGYAYGAAWRK